MKNRSWGCSVTRTCLKSTVADPVAVQEAMATPTIDQPVTNKEGVDALNTLMLRKLAKESFMSEGGPRKAGYSGESHCIKKATTWRPLHEARSATVLCKCGWHMGKELFSSFPKLHNNMTHKDSIKRNPGGSFDGGKIIPEGVGSLMSRIGLHDNRKKSEPELPLLQNSSRFDKALQPKTLVSTQVFLKSANLVPGKWPQVTVPQSSTREFLSKLHNLQSCKPPTESLARTELIRKIFRSDEAGVEEAISSKSSWPEYLKGDDNVRRNLRELIRLEESDQGDFGANLNPIALRSANFMPKQGSEELVRFEELARSLVTRQLCDAKQEGSVGDHRAPQRLELSNVARSKYEEVQLHGVSSGVDTKSESNTTPRNEWDIAESTIQGLRLHVKKGRIARRAERIFPAGISEAVVQECIALAKDSSDPYADFCDSMLEMMQEKNLWQQQEEMQDLLQCFLHLNQPVHHPLIHQAFSHVVSSGSPMPSYHKI